jgi:hypothetical protein
VIHISSPAADKTSPTPKRKRHHLSPRPSWQQAVILGLSGPAERERLMGDASSIAAARPGAAGSTPAITASMSQSGPRHQIIPVRYGRIGGEPGNRVIRLPLFSTFLRRQSPCHLSPQLEPSFNFDRNEHTPLELRERDQRNRVSRDLQ